MLLEQMEHVVRSKPNELINHHFTVYLGTVRKALQVGFVGESREDGQMYIVDAYLEGLPNRDVRHNSCFLVFLGAEIVADIVFLG